MKSSAKNVDMLSGPLFSNILKFVIPFMLTAFIQHLYNAADVVVVGRYAGRTALAAVGSTGNITNLIIDLILGLSVGVSISLGHAIGAGDLEKQKKTVHTAILLSILSGAVVSIIGIVFAEPLLRLIEVPESIMPQAKIYMQIIFCGKTPSLIYNFGAGIFRANGDTKTPMYIVSASGIINILLNLFFVICLDMAAGGVALATVISQLFTAIVVIYKLTKRTDGSRLYLKKLKIHAEELRSIVKIGLPSGIQSLVFSGANVIVYAGINSFGDAVIAGNAAGTNIGNFYNAAVNSFYQAAVSFTSQNIGAKQYNRINKIIGICLLDVTIIWSILIFISLVFGESLVGFYAPGDVEAIHWGVVRLIYVGCLYGLVGYMNVMSGALRGMRYSFLCMIAAIVGVCGIRIVWVYTVFPIVNTYENLLLCFPLSWFGTFVFYSIVYVFVMRKLKRAAG